MLTDENKVIAVLSPRLFGEGSKRSLWVQTDVLLVLPNRPFTHKAFCHRKANAQYSVSNCVRGIPTVQVLGQENGLHFFWKGSSVSRKREELFAQNPQPFFVLTVSSISRCLPHTPLNGYARCSPRNLKGCCLCRLIYAQ